MVLVILTRSREKTYLEELPAGHGAAAVPQLQVGEVGQLGEVVHVGGLHVLEAEQGLWEKEEEDFDAVL